MDSRLFDFDYEVYGNGRLFYLNEVVEKVDGSDAGPILKDKHYEMMMVKNRITVLNKAECGNGGTSGIVDYLKRHNIGGLILVPNVSISKGKEVKYKDDPNICCVYGGVDKIDWEAKIVIATYDQFKRLLANLRDFGFAGDIFSNEFWRGRAIFVDEYHKLVDESKFRGIMAELTELIINTDLPITLMSATPHYDYICALREAVGDKKEVVSINVVYKDRRMTKRMSIYNPKASEIDKIIKKYIDGNYQVCIFYNNVKRITKILNDIGTEDCEILCSESRKKDCGNYYSNSYTPTKKMHFMTSAYFTGHDIDEFSGKVIVIGSNSTVAGALGMRDIKQLLGRFREYCGESMSNIHLLYVWGKKDDDAIQTQLNSTEKILEGLGDNWIMNAACIEQKLKNMYCNDALERLEYWSSTEKLIKKLKNSGYVVDTLMVDGKQTLKAKPIGELPDYEVEPNLTYREAYTRIANGEDVSWKEYRDVNKIKNYIDKYSITRKADGSIVIPARNRIFNLVKINEVVENRKNRSPFDEMSVDDRYVAFGFDDCAIYKASYLMNCLEYIQMENPELIFGELDYGLLPVYMKEVFGAVMFCWKVGTKKNGSAHQWCVIGQNVTKQLKFGKTTGSYPFWGSSIYIEQLHQKGEDYVVNPIKLSYRIVKKSGCYGRTIDWRELPKYIPSLTGIPLYDWVLEDKTYRLNQVKNNKSDLKTWGNIKNFEQLQISEFYQNTTNEYRYIKSEMNEISSLIIDIDDSLSFYKFKELYKEWAWLAYPTISNTAPNSWNKFRVIIPLAHPIRIEGDNNLKVLKALRSSFCAYEDKCHQTGSYVNLSDWGEKHINKGRLYSIEQSDVDLLQYLISVVSDYSKKKFDAKEIDVNVKSDRRWWNLDKAIKLYEEADASPMEGARHASLFKIKNNLSEKDCDRFEDWLREHYPSVVKKHWQTHKRIAS